MKFGEAVQANHLSDLYHVTKYQSAANILENDYFRQSSVMSGPRGFSTTEDPDYWWGSREVRFVLSRGKLGQKYKMAKQREKIFMNNGKRLKESEVRVLTNSALVNAHTFVKSIQYVRDESNPFFAEFMDRLQEYTRKYGVKSEEIK